MQSLDTFFVTFSESYPPIINHHCHLSFSKVQRALPGEMENSPLCGLDKSVSLIRNQGKAGF